FFGGHQPDLGPGPQLARCTGRRDGIVGVDVDRNALHALPPTAARCESVWWRRPPENLRLAELGPMTARKGGFDHDLGRTSTPPNFGLPAAAACAAAAFFSAAAAWLEALSTGSFTASFAADSTAGLSTKNHSTASSASRASNASSALRIHFGKTATCRCAPSR